MTIGRSRRPSGSAIKISGLVRLRFHDFRHTFATRHAIKGTDIATLQTLGRWKTLEMVRKYQHLQPDQLEAAMEAPYIKIKAIK